MKASRAPVAAEERPTALALALEAQDPAEAARRLHDVFRTKRNGARLCEDFRPDYLADLLRKAMGGDGWSASRLASMPAQVPELRDWLQAHLEVSA